MPRMRGMNMKREIQLAHSTAALDRGPIPWRSPTGRYASSDTNVVTSCRRCEFVYSGAAQDAHAAFADHDCGGNR